MSHAPDAHNPSIRRLFLALVLFGLGFGYVEGSVVVYLRGFYDPMHQRLYPQGAAGDLFPLVTLDQLKREDPAHYHRLFVELAREAATIVLLAAVPWTFCRNFREWLAGFMVGFGVWDLAYYATLKLTIGWPASWLTWDLLFLLPLPWSGPVLAPCLVSLSIIAAGWVLLWYERRRQPVLIKRWEWLGIVTGGAVVVASFCWEGSTVARGGMPTAYPWAVFWVGEMVGVLCFLRAVVRAEHTYREGLR